MKPTCFALLAVLLSLASPAYPAQQSTFTVTLPRTFKGINHLSTSYQVRFQTLTKVNHHKACSQDCAVRHDQSSVAHEVMHDVTHLTPKFFSELPCQPEERKLLSGSFLFYFDRGGDIPFENASINARANTSLLIEKADDYLRVVDLTDSNSHSVTIHYKDRDYALTPGGELVIEKNDADHLFPDRLHRFDTSISADSSGHCVIVDSISLEELLLSHPEIHQLERSRDRRERKEFRRILKTCAAMSFVKHRAAAIY